jgi:hypothetical protein
MIHHVVDPNARTIDSDDLDSMPGLTADVVARWAPVITTLLSEIGEILRGRTVGEAKA